jgi:alpha-tubulin suppressor-like RCC1 family protein
MLRAYTTRALAATACAAAVLSLAPMLPAHAGAPMPARLSGGPPVVTDTNCATTAAHECGMAGYQASSCGFRYAQALITVPGHTGSVSTDPALYVALDHPGGSRYGYARAGVQPCGPGWKGGRGCPAGDTSGWEIFARVEQPGTRAAGILRALPTAVPGGTVFASVYFSRAAGIIRVHVHGPRQGGFTATFAVHQPVYTRAEALADWTLATARPRPTPPAQTATTRVTQFAQGAFTTLGGHPGTFHGRWALRPVEAATTGRAPPAGVLIAQPSGLWTGPASAGWGNTFGIWLTGGPATPTPTPTTPPGTLVAVSTGRIHTCAVHADRTLWCWGSNSSGQLGDGTTTDRDVPVQESTHASDWSAVTGGFAHTCAVKTSGTLWCWGSNSNGQFGDGSTAGSDFPVQETTDARDWAAVSAGQAHTCAVKTSGTLWCWGYNSNGQLGDAGTVDSAVPVQESTHASDWDAVTARYAYTCAVKTAGTLWCWGSNSSGQLGDGTTTGSAVPVQESTHASDWAAVSARYLHTCAIKTAGTLWCWGSNSSGQLGDGTTTGSAVPVQESTHASDWASVSVGFAHTCAVKTAGTLWCWGSNSNGQFGDGTTTGSAVPVQESTHASDWASVTVAFADTCAVKTSGTLWCWGYNSNGQLGDGTTTDSYVPVQVTG